MNLFREPPHLWPGVSEGLLYNDGDAPWRGPVTVGSRHSEE